MADTEVKQKTSSMDSTFPVLLPEDSALCFSGEKFQSHIRKSLPSLTGNEKALDKMDIEDSHSDNTTLASDATKTYAIAVSEGKKPGHPFMEALNAEADRPVVSLPPTEKELAADNKTLTDNLGVAFASTKSALVDLFSELEKVVAGPRLNELLDAAWKVHSLATLKIVWNARSIHLGKGEKETFYRCIGWMKDEHPQTVLINLQWMFRSVIEKKVKEKTEDEAVVVEQVGSTPDDYEVLHGVSHGYWKDLLNLLVLSAQDKLGVLENPRDVLNEKNEQPRYSDRKYRRRNKVRKREGQNKAKQIDKLVDKERKERDDRIKAAVETNYKQRELAKASKHGQEAARHKKLLERWKAPFYRALHLTVARLFAEQLKKDVALLKSGTKEDLRRLTYCGKWAPSLEGFHDKHTFVATSIAELLFPKSSVGEEGDSRELYLKRARESYRRLVLSPLRKALEIVERDISANTFADIKYDRVPSIAMDTNKNLFAKKDTARFEQYIDRVAQGKSRISGAVLMPATLVRQARETSYYGEFGYSRPIANSKNIAKSMLENKMKAIESKVVDGQWNTLVQRIKDSGVLTDSIAVCDVSGSMCGPTFPDGTCPMDSSIGLSLLLAEITKPPFGGAFISFDTNPQIMRCGGPEDSRTFTEKVKYIQEAPWGGSTDFVAVFEKVILPLAVKNKIKQEDMVKQIFVFSDMQFNDAGSSRYSSRGTSWETHYEHIKRKFEQAGYEPPQLIFWNLAGARHGDLPKPVTDEHEGTALVSGYSQGLMKVFLEHGGFDDVEEEEELMEVSVEAGAEGEAATVEVKKTKRKTDPLATVKKAIGHKAYEMLKVVD